MNGVAWVKEIRSECGCNIVHFYALLNAFEITATRFIGDKEYSFVAHVLFHTMQNIDDDAHQRRQFIDGFKRKYPQLFADTESL
jgi:hypothetical protein